MRRHTEKSRKRGGHLFSKHRYLAAQLLAYVQDDLWLRNARHANEAAKALQKSLENMGATAAFTPQGNELFIHMNDDLAKRLRGAGIVFRPWASIGPDAYRFVCAWNSPIELIKSLPQSIG